MKLHLFFSLLALGYASDHFRRVKSEHSFKGRNNLIASNENPVQRIKNEPLSRVFLLNAFVSWNFGITFAVPALAKWWAEGVGFGYSNDVASIYKVWALSIQAGLGLTQFLTATHVDANGQAILGKAMVMWWLLVGTSALLHTGPLRVLLPITGGVMSSLYLLALSDKGKKA